MRVDLPQDIVATKLMLASGQASVEEVVRQYLHRADASQPWTNAFVTIDHEGAMLQARELDAATETRRQAPLFGVPVALKDHMAVRGLPTTYGTGLLPKSPAEEDGTLAARLRAAGAILLGKTNMDPLGRGAAGDNPWFGRIRNPWSHDHSPGGSSGGSAAALATRSVLGSMGSDGGGSIRIPAAMCGVVGHKPSPGLVSRYDPPRAPWATCLFYGPMAGSVADVALLLDAIAGRDALDPTTSPDGAGGYARGLTGPRSPLRIGIPERYFFEDISSEVGDRVQQALGELQASGASLRVVDIPLLNEVEGAWRTIGMAERAARGNLEAPGLRPEQLPEKYRAPYEVGSRILAVDYLHARELQGAFRQAVDAVLSEVDVLVTPTCAVTEVPWAASAAHASEDVMLDTRVVRIGAKEVNAFTAVSRLTRPFSLSGHPCLSVPCGFTARGLPVGMQIVARLGDDLTALQLGHLYQTLSDWHRATPRLGPRHLSDPPGSLGHPGLETPPPYPASADAVDMKGGKP